MFGWSSPGRLKPMKIVWLKSMIPQYEIAKARKPDIVAWKRALCGLPLIDQDRDRRRNYPRVIDEYGIVRRPVKR